MSFREIMVSFKYCISFVAAPAQRRDKRLPQSSEILLGYDFFRRRTQ